MATEDDWHLSYTSFKPEEEGLRETLTTLGNGYFATRGTHCFSDADEVHYPGTYLAGGYNRLQTHISGKVIENEDLVNLPNWLSLKFKIQDEEWFKLEAVEILSYHRELNLKKGLLKNTIKFKDQKARISSLTEERIVHMKDPHLAAIKLSIKAHNWSGKIALISSLNGNVSNDGIARYRALNSKHLSPKKISIPDHHTLFLQVETVQSKITIAQAARHLLQINQKKLNSDPKKIEDEGSVSLLYQCDLQEKETLSIEKTVSIYTSKDHAISESGEMALLAVKRAPQFERLIHLHAQIWNSLWVEFDLTLQLADPQTNRHPQLILRLHIFHLLQTTSMNTIDLDVGVPARGWHGEAYRGHVFWDELFIFPLLNLKIPKITLALLKYRFRRLDEARFAAKKQGFKGAMFPWQSGSTGREESQLIHLNPKSGRWVPDHSALQRHVNLSIAYNIWKYYEVTGDLDFMRSYGAEMLLEIARFVASLTQYNQKYDKFEILGIMGPDEYHDAYPNHEKPGINNNSYTNILSAWVLSKALELLKILPEDHYKELIEILAITDEETSLWEQISRKMRLCFHKDGILTQFEGYEELIEFPWQVYREKYTDIQRLDRILESEGDSANRYKLSKQADLLMIFYLFSLEELSQIFNQLGYPFDRGLVPVTIDYYEKRTSHGSTLSKIVHAWVLSREDRTFSWNLFLGALESDIEDVQGGTTKEGIHLGAMAGTVDLIQRCYTGAYVKDHILWLNPSLPQLLTHLNLHLHYRGHSIELKITQNTCSISSKKSIAPPVLIGFKEKQYTLSSEKTLNFYI